MNAAAGTTRGAGVFSHEVSAHLDTKTPSPRTVSRSEPVRGEGFQPTINRANYIGIMEDEYEHQKESNPKALFR